MLHSLAGINGLRYNAMKRIADPSFQLGGMVFVAANISPVGFGEIKSHFLDFGEYTAVTLLANLAVDQVAMLHGGHDPYVSIEHGIMLADDLVGNVYVDNNEAHFSGEHRDERTGLYIPPCKFNLTLAFILSKMITNVAPPGRYDTSVELRMGFNDIRLEND